MDRNATPPGRRALLCLLAGTAGAGGVPTEATGTTGSDRPPASAPATTGDGNHTGGATASGNASTAVEPTTPATRTVAMTDSLVFDPASITVRPGTTVVWENVGGVGHTVTAYDDGIPDDAEYFASGGYGSESAARSGYTRDGPGVVAGGETYEHTFEATGTYEYFCIPHESSMTGTVEVAEDAGRATERDPEDFGVPFRAHYIGLASIAGVVLSLVFAFFVVKYGESGHAGGGGRG